MIVEWPGESTVKSFVTISREKTYEYGFILCEVYLKFAHMS